MFGSLSAGRTVRIGATTCHGSSPFRWSRAGVFADPIPAAGAHLCAMIATEPRSLPRPQRLRGWRSPFVLGEIALWASVYPGYLAIRGHTVGSAEEAQRHALSVVQLERHLSLAHERAVQHLVSFARDFFSAYYMVGFGPAIVTLLVWFA